MTDAADSGTHEQVWTEVDGPPITTQEDDIVKLWEFDCSGCGLSMGATGIIRDDERGRRAYHRECAP